MAGVTKGEFSKIYNERFLPVLKELEEDRLETEKKIKPYYIPMTICGVLAAIGFIIPFFSLLVFIGIIGVLGFYLYISHLRGLVRHKLKKEILTKILALFENLYVSDNKNVVSPQEINDMGLFPRFTFKHDDDIFIGIHKGCNFAIDECTLTHEEGSGKSSRTVVDFNGLLVKIQMNKKFSGKTVVGVNGYIQKKTGYEEIKLEDIEFTKRMKVYSTDQIEARYILTTTLIERLFSLARTFINSREATSGKTNPKEPGIPFSEIKLGLKTGLLNLDSPSQAYVSAAFIDGYVYLFIPKTENFFEIDISTCLLDENKYFDVYCQIQLILSVIDYLKLDLKLGL